jgi:hypothetical protein
MLQTDAVSQEVLELLKALQNKPYLASFHLVGGTALALYYGHRRSIDLDLFANVRFNTGRLLEEIQQDFSYQLYSTAQYTLKGSISEINVDILAHRYPYLKEPHNEDGISLLSEKDLIAMKLNAISISGQRSKDFIDIYYALKRHTLSEILSFYRIKYKQQSTAHVVKSLIYFTDVDLANWPVLLADPQLSWSTVKKELKEKVKKLMQDH